MTTDTPSDLVKQLRFSEVLGTTGDPVADKMLAAVAALLNKAADRIEADRQRIERLERELAELAPSNESIEHAREYCEDDGIRLPSVHRDALVTMAREILRLAAAPGAEAARKP